MIKKILISLGVVMASLLCVFSFNKVNADELIDTSTLTQTSNQLPLIDYDENTVNGLTYSVSNGAIYLNGTSINAYTFIFASDLNITSSSFTLATFFNMNGVNPTQRIELIFSTSESFYYLQNYISSSNYTSSQTYSQTSTAGTITFFRLYVPGSTTFSNAVIKPMLVDDSTIPNYFTPYGYVVDNEDITSWNTAYSTLETNYNNLLSSYNILQTNYTNLYNTLNQPTNLYSWFNLNVSSYEVVNKLTNDTTIISGSLSEEYTTSTGFTVADIYSSLLADGVNPGSSSNNWADYGSNYYLKLNLNNLFSLNGLGYITGSALTLLNNNVVVATSNSITYDYISTDFNVVGDTSTFNQVRLDLSPDDNDLSLLGLTFSGSLLQNYYNLGYSDGYNNNNTYYKGLYDSLNEEYTSLNNNYNSLLAEYDSAVSSAYSQGYNEGVASVSSTSSVVSGLFGSIANVPITILNSLMGPTIFNVPIVSILLSFLGILVVVWLIKKII